MSAATRSKTGKRAPVLVLGGGINGAAVARELLLNQIPVVLVDRADIAWGATSASSRLIHGGLRYLEYADIGLVRESLAERARLLELAPQFVRPLRLFIPIEQRFSGALASAARFVGAARLASWLKSAPRGLWIVRSGLHFYDLLARQSELPRHAVHRVGDPGVPPVAADRYRWACSYYDAQMPLPERFVLALLRDARQLAAQHSGTFHVYTHHHVTRRDRLLRLSPQAPRSTAPDAAAPPACEFEPSFIVNATGAWVDRTLQQLDVPCRRLIGGTKGSHILTRQPDLRAALGDRALYAEAADGRPVFLLPLGPFVMIGTTDLPIGDDPEQATTDPAEVQYLLGTVQQVFPQVPLTTADIDLHCWGVRPLPFNPSANPAAVTRRHLLETQDAAGIPVLSLIGGKLTTCRQLAEEVTAAVCARLEVPAVNNSRQRPIPGSDGYADGPAAVYRAQQELAASAGWSESQVHAVWRLCGSLATGLLAEPADPGGRRNLPGTTLPECVARRILAEEWCTRLSDLVIRRLVLTYTATVQPAALERLAQLMCETGLLGERALDAELAHCRQELAEQHGIRL